MHHHITEHETRRRLFLGMIEKPTSKNRRRSPGCGPFRYGVAVAFYAAGVATAAILATLTHCLP